MPRFVFNPFTDKLDDTGRSGGGGGGGVETLTGNTGGPVGPDGSDNINIIGTGAITVSGNAGTNTLTISSGNPFFTWVVVNSNTLMDAQKGYFTDSGGVLIMTLPSPSVLGDVVCVTDMGGGGWKIVGAGAEQMRLGDQISTANTGFLQSTKVGDGVTLVCAVADTLWIEAQGGSQGNITVS